MTSQYIINFEHVELMKVTSDTTIYVRFASGTGEVIEFKNAEQVNDMTKAFFAWSFDRSPSNAVASVGWSPNFSSHKLYFIDKEMK